MSNKKKPEKKYDDDVCQSIGPGPAAYLIPSTVGQGPAFSITGRGASTKIRSDTPGPIYNVYGMTRYGKGKCSTGYSINSRVKGPSTAGLPGPGTYSPEKFPYPMGRASPAFTIQGRQSLKLRTFGPGPNQYKVPTSIGSKVPDMVAAPAALLMGRLHTTFKSVGPGPAAYGIPNYDAIRYVYPVPIISGRTHRKGGWTGPSPLDYYPKYISGPTPPSFSIRSRTNRCIKPYITPLDNCD